MPVNPPTPFTVTSTMSENVAPRTMPMVTSVDKCNFGSSVTCAGAIVSTKPSAAASTGAVASDPLGVSGDRSVSNEQALAAARAHNEIGLHLTPHSIGRFDLPRVVAGDERACEKPP